jgi:hypothetical protein
MCLWAMWWGGVVGRAGFMVRETFQARGEVGHGLLFICSLGQLPCCLHAYLPPPSPLPLLSGCLCAPQGAARGPDAV